MILNSLKKGLYILSAGLTLAFLASPMQAEASSIMPTAGIATIFDTRISEEEYIDCAIQSQGAYWGYTNIGLANVESGNLNVRENPSTSSKLVGKMAKGSACEVVEEVNGWALIVSGDVEGYVSMDYLLTGPAAKIKAADIVRTVAIAKTDGLNVRTAPSTDAGILTQIPKDEELEFVEMVDDWVKVNIDDDEAYIFSEYVNVEEKIDTAITMSELLYGNGVSDVRVAMVEYAKQFLGNPYVWGGTSLTKGTDCSGFTMSIYKKYGITLSHSSRAQANEGKKITVAELQPGDLIFYANGSGTINHVAMYIGGGQVIHASNPKSGIKIGKYNYRTPVKCVSYLND